EYLLTVLALPRRFQHVAAHNIAPAALPLAHHDLLDFQGRMHRPEPARPSEHLLLDLRELAHGHGQDIMAEPLGQCLPIRLRVHPRVTNEDGTPKFPAP